MLTPAQAEEQIARHLPCLPIESLPVSQCAGAVLRENVYAERDQPPFDRVAMDGIAVASQQATGGRALRVQGTQAACDPPLALESPLHCIEIMTGAMLPTGCDAVIPVERIGIAKGEARIEAGIGPEENADRAGRAVCAAFRLGLGHAWHRQGQRSCHRAAQEMPGY